MARITSSTRLDTTRFWSASCGHELAHGNLAVFGAGDHDLVAGIERQRRAEPLVQPEKDHFRAAVPRDVDHRRALGVQHVVGELADVLALDQGVIGAHDRQARKAP